MSIHALLYHDVIGHGGELHDSGFKGASAASYKLSLALFEEHLDAIHQACASIDQRIGLIGDAITTKNGNRTVLTFDDGGVSALTEIAPCLEAAGWLGYFFITTNCIGKRGFLSEAQIRELDMRGHVIASHSCSHPPRMASLSHRMLLAEWRDSLAKLTDILQKPVSIASVPGGFYSRAVGRAAAEAGVKILFTSEPVQNIQNISSMLLVGRFSVMNTDSAEYAARLAIGDARLRYKQWCLWNAKKVVKRTVGKPYLALREKYFERR